MLDVAILFRNARLTQHVGVGNASSAGESDERCSRGRDYYRYASDTFAKTTNRNFSADNIPEPDQIFDPSQCVAHKGFVRTQIGEL